MALQKVIRNMLSTGVSDSSDATAITIDSSENSTFAGNIVKGNLTISGTEIDLSSGDLTIDVAGNIILDADSDSIKFKDGGTEYGKIYGASSNFYFNCTTQDKDIIFVGDDGGSSVTALTLDMSDAGAATFNSNVNVGGIGHVNLSGSTSEVSVGVTGDTDNSGGGVSFAHNTSTLNSYVLGQKASMTIGSAISTPLLFVTNNTERMRIDANGSTTFTKTGTNASPHIKLVESGDAREFNIFNDGSGNGHIVLADSDDDTPDTEIVLNDNGIITMLTGNSERMRINANGKVSIGGTEDTYDLMIKRPSAASATSLVLQRVWNQNQAWQAEALTEYFTDLESTAYPRAQVGFYRGDTSDNNSSGFIVKTGLSSSGMATRFKVTATGMVEMPEQPAFMAKLTSAQTITGTNTTVAFNSESFDRKGNHSNGVFTAPHAGVYLFGANFLVYPWTTGVFNFAFYKDSSNYSSTIQSGPAAGSHSNVSHQCLIECAKNDEITVNVSGSGMDTNATVYGGQAYWWGYMVG